MKHLLFLASLGFGLNVFAVKSLPQITAPEVKMSAEELLSLPAANRLEVAKKRGHEFVPALEKIAFTSTQDFGMRWNALSLAAQLEGPAAEKLLKKAVAAPEWYMRNAALLAYQAVLPTKSKSVAENLLDDKALVVRSAAVQVLSASLDEATREILWSQLENARNFRKKQGLFIRGQILSVLAQDPLAKEMPLFMKHLREEDSRLHAPAIAALEKVTSRTLGGRKDDLAHKRDLWIKWAKNQGSEMSL